MEKLSLDKFQDVKLDNNQLSYIHAGDTCTGGGGGRTCIGIVQVDYDYDSDSVDDCGNTSYNGLTFSNSQICP